MFEIHQFKAKCLNIQALELVRSRLRRIQSLNSTKNCSHHRIKTFLLSYRRWQFEETHH